MTGYHSGPTRRRFLAAGATFAASSFLMGLSRSLPATDSIVEVESGRLKGRFGNGVHAFRGIPYAAPTGGPNRFLAPRPVPAWSGVRDALAVSDRCPQIAADDFQIPSRSNWLSWYAETSPFSEDCCKLNIFTPTMDEAAKLPVMVYIHGGGYRTGGAGSPALDGTNLATSGSAVVVTLNHRLNVFGFTDLSAWDEDFIDSANAGQLDLVAALNWVKTNIGKFGGDRDCVTLFGQSGGGSKISTLMIMPAAKGLFHRVINMSGSSGYGIGPAADRHAVTAEFLRLLGIDRRNLGKLRDAAATDMLAAHKTAVASLVTDDYRPVVDGRNIPFATQAPEALQLHADVPMLIGNTASEATAWLAKDPRNRGVSAAQVQSRLQAQFGLSQTEGASIYKAYRDARPERTPYDILAAIASDVLYRGRMSQAALEKSDLGAAPVYYYGFAWNVQAENGYWGSPHACDIPFAFRNLALASAMTGGSPGAERTSVNYAAAFVRFARQGDPNGRGMPHWKRFDRQSRTVMQINARYQPKDHFLQHELDASGELAKGPAFKIYAGPLMKFS